MDDMSYKPFIGYISGDVSRGRPRKILAFKPGLSRLKRDVWCAYQLCFINNVDLKNNNKNDIKSF